MNKKIKRIIKIILTSITGVFLIASLYLIICNIVAMRNDKPVRIFGYSYSYVPTESMEPTIKAGDSIIFKKAPYSSLEIGDIIVYQSKTGNTKGMYIVHRIVEETEYGFVMRGDNNPTSDPEIINESMYVGKYVRRFNLFNVSKILNNKGVIYGILILFFLGIMILESANIFLAAQKKRQKNIAPHNEVEDIKQELLSEMREEILKEINENNKKE